jgi:hypothetical protein
MDAEHNEESVKELTRQLRTIKKKSDVSALSSSWYFHYSLKVEALDIISDLTKAVLYNKVS